MFKNWLTVLVLSITGASGAFAGDDFTGAEPFGFKWSQSIKSAEHKKISDIDLKTKQQVLDDNYRHNLGFDCQKYVLRGISSFRASYSDVLGSSADPKPYETNSIGADMSIGGRVTAAIVEVEYRSKPMPVCLVFFDDRLYAVQTYYSQLNRLGLFDAFSSDVVAEYGEGRTLCSETLCDQIWVDEKNSIEISKVVPNNSTPLYVNFTYGPLKAQSMKAWVELFMESSPDNN